MKMGHLPPLLVRHNGSGICRISRLEEGSIRELLPEMTYTETGFSNPVRVVFDTILRPTTRETRETIAEHFREAIRRHRQEVHIVDRFILAPLRSGASRIANALAALHHGRIKAYVGYCLITLVIALVLFLETSG